jgi:hypothetical protein
VGWSRRCGKYRVLLREGRLAQQSRHRRTYGRGVRISGQADNAGAVLGHLRRCSDQDHLSTAGPLTAMTRSGRWATSARDAGGAVNDFHNDRPSASEDLTGEVAWSGNSWRGGRDAATPPVCQRHRTRSSDRVAVLHDPLQSAVPWRLRRPCRCRSLANGTAREHRFTSRAPP